MAEYVIMPKLGFNMDKGTLVRWIKKEGDLVKEQEVLFEIETDKTVMEVEAQTSGILRKTLVAEGEEVPVTLPIAIIGDRDDDISKMIDEAYQKLGKSEMTEEEPKAAKRISQRMVEKREIKPKKEKKEFKKISPGARKKAKELGVEVELAEGSGSGGVVIENDILDYFQLKRETSKTLIEEKEIEKRIPYTGIRKIIGDRLSQSKFTAPHIYFTTSVDMSEVIKLLKRFSQDTKNKISINDFLIFAVAKVLSEQPNINCSLAGEEIVYHRDIHIGIAVSVEKGLIVPVLKNANKKSLPMLSEETKNLIKLARERKLMPDDYQGGTFTVSNLGMYEIESFTAIINPPEAAILAVGEIKKIPAVIEEDGVEKIEVRSLMKMTLSADHRLIDGVTAANFLKQVKYYLEFPEQPVL
ncbi:MAG TPA: dihydrolipoamide acetyltransferase family protein [Atribacterota bacterium]|nr:dihydrolipoamide acetyltransferase family protein [Atribacterota bacterium]